MINRENLIRTGEREATHQIGRVGISDWVRFLYLAARLPSLEAMLRIPRDTFWRENVRWSVYKLVRQKSPTDKKILDRQNILDRQKKFSIGERILDWQEKISQNQYQFSKGGFASRYLEWHLGLWSWELDLKYNLDHFCPLWLSIDNNNNNNNIDTDLSTLQLRENLPAMFTRPFS